MPPKTKNNREPVGLVSAECGCAVRDASAASRKALGVDPEIKSRNITRLRRIEGQLRGLQKMVEEDRYCADILTQISSVQEALRGVGRELMRNHLPGRFGRVGKRPTGCTMSWWTSCTPIAGNCGKYSI